MEEFAKMIYRQWLNSEDADGIIWDDYMEACEELHKILNLDIADKIETAITRSVWIVQEQAFIEGFAYACKCLSNGKIEFGGR